MEIREREREGIGRERIEEGGMERDKRGREREIGLSTEVLRQPLPAWPMVQLGRHTSSKPHAHVDRVLERAKRYHIIENLNRETRRREMARKGDGYRYEERERERQKMGL